MSRDAGPLQKPSKLYKIYLFKLLILLYTTFAMCGSTRCTILFKAKKLHALSLKIHPHTRIHQIVPVITKIHFNPQFEKNDHISYALLELINNSLRAHRERNVPDPVLVRLRASKANLRIEVKDRGGGFDPTLLPYNIFDSPPPENLNTEPFLQYRRLHENKRFGIGLIVVKRIFKSLSVEFIDSAEQPLPWGDPGVVGTRIIADIKPWIL